MKSNNKNGIKNKENNNNKKKENKTEVCQIKKIVIRSDDGKRMCIIVYLQHICMFHFDVFCTKQ